MNLTPQMTPLLHLQLRPRQIFLLGSAVVMWVGFISALLVFTVAAGTATQWVLYTLRLLLLIAPIFLIKSPSLFNPIVFVGLWAIVRTALPETGLLLEGLMDHPALHGISNSVKAQLVSKKLALDCLALLATYSGYVSIQKVSLRKLPNFSPSGIRLKLIIVMTLIFLILARIHGEVGGLEEIYRTKGKYLAIELGGGHWNFMAGIGAPAIWLAAAFMRSPQRSILFWTSTVFVLMAEFIVIGSRGGAINIAIVLFLIFLMKRSSFSSSKVLAVMLLSVIAAGYLTNLRADIQGYESAVTGSEKSPLYKTILLAGVGLEVLVSYSSSGNSDFPIYQFVPENSDYLFGRSYVTIFAAPIPRVIWPEKPMGVGRLASETFMPEYKHGTGVPPSPTGEAFWNFGVLGVLSIFFFWGGFLKFLWLHFRSTNNPGVAVVYVTTIFFLQPHTSMFYNWLHSFVAVVIILGFFCFPKMTFKNFSSGR